MKFGYNWHSCFGGETFELNCGWTTTMEDEKTCQYYKLRKALGSVELKREHFGPQTEPPTRCLYSGAKKRKYRDMSIIIQVTCTLNI